MTDAPDAAVSLKELENLHDDVRDHQQMIVNLHLLLDGFRWWDKRKARTIGRGLVELSNDITRLGTKIHGLSVRSTGR